MKRKIATEFEMKDLGMMHYFLGMESGRMRMGSSSDKGVCGRDPEEIWDDGQNALTTPMASNLKLLIDASSESVDATMYRQMIGPLMYLMNTRPDIFFVVNTLSQFLIDPRHVHLIVAKHILRYLKGTVDYGLEYKADQKINLEGYVDSDWQAVPSIGRALQGVASVWDQV